MTQIAQLEQSLKTLPPKYQIRLFQILERSTRYLRWNPFLSRIRERSSKRPLSEKIIRRLCEDVRQEQYARRSH